MVQVTREGSPFREYSPDAVQPAVYLSLLRHMYRLYRLLRGTLASQTREELSSSTAAIFDSVSRGGTGFWCPL